MNAPFRHHALRFQRGIAAIEFALILPVLLAMLAFGLFFGRVYWHYSAAVKAAHDATRYLSTVPMNDMKSASRAANVVQVARAIALEEIADLNPGPDAPVVTIQCSDGFAPYTCDGFSTPVRIDATVRLAIYDTTLYGFTYQVLGDQPFVLTAAVTMRYVGK